MAFYNFEEGKKRVEENLKNNEEIEEKNVPKDDSEFTYSNGIKSWIGSIFVDIVKSSDIIGKEEDIKVSKILRSFSSELITIMNILQKIMVNQQDVWSAIKLKWITLRIITTKGGIKMSKFKVGDTVRCVNNYGFEGRNEWNI